MYFEKKNWRTPKTFFTDLWSISCSSDPDRPYIVVSRKNNIRCLLVIRTTCSNSYINALLYVRFCARGWRFRTVFTLKSYLYVHVYCNYIYIQTWASKHYVVQFQSAEQIKNIIMLWLRHGRSEGKTIIFDLFFFTVIVFIYTSVCALAKTAVPCSHRNKICYFLIISP